MRDIYADPTSGLPALVDHTGAVRLLARHEPSSSTRLKLARFGDVHPLIPEDEWRDIDLLTAYNPAILNQGQTGSCVGHGCAEAFGLGYAIQGEPITRFSSCYLYSLLNGGRDGGASIGDSIQALQTYGICLESTVPEGDIFRRDYNTTKADAEAKNYVLVEAYSYSEPAEKASAIQMGFCGADSVMCGRSFDDLDYRGIAGLAGVDRGPGNHCTMWGGMMKTTGGLWVYMHQNSWGAQWGQTGRFLTCDDHINSQSQYEGVVYRVVSSGSNAPVLAA